MELIFYLFSILTIISTIQVINQNCPIHALLYLIISIISISCIFFTLGSYFAGALEIIIYASAIMVLFIFVIMMLNIDFNLYKKKYFFINYKNNITLLIIESILLLILILSILNSNTHKIIQKFISIKNIGIALFGPYFLIVELVSMLLLSGIVVVFHIGNNNYKNNNTSLKKFNKNIIKKIKKGN